MGAGKRCNLFQAGARGRKVGRAQESPQLLDQGGTHLPPSEVHLGWGQIVGQEPHQGWDHMEALQRELGAGECPPLRLLPPRFLPTPAVRTWPSSAQEPQALFTGQSRGGVAESAGYTHTHTHILKHTRSHTHAHVHTHSCTHSLRNTHTLTQPFIYSLTCTHTLTFSPEADRVWQADNRKPKFYQDMERGLF